MAVTVKGADMQQRSAVVDLGSNSVRLVVFEGVSRNPMPIFNEKAVLRLGRGLTATGRLNEEGVGMAVEVLSRFHAIAKAMQADPFEILATAAVRDAANGPAFVAMLRDTMPGVSVRILSGEEEADHSAIGVMCGIPGAEGVVADVGGGSLELIHLNAQGRHDVTTLPLGMIRLSDRAEGDLVKARQLADEDIGGVKWLQHLQGSTLYLVGGAFRALARLDIARKQYPLNIVHYYTLEAKDANDLTSWLLTAPRRTLERLPGAPRKRLDDVPFAATVLRRLIRKVQPDRVVFCVDGLREGWYMLNVAPDRLAQDPMESVAREMCDRLGRSSTLPAVLHDWTDCLNPAENSRDRYLRRIACYLSDIGSHDHPEYRAEQTYWRVLRVQGAGFDHQARAWLSLALAVRYSAELSAPFLGTSRLLLNEAQWRSAVAVGLALRLAYSLSGGAGILLDGTSLAWQGPELVLTLTSARVAVKGEGVRRGLERLGQALDVPTRFAVDLPGR
ncbi:Ppx/GppA family phosphatase [Acetobacter sp.]|uniref:Ppx/GppA phosphatase family protein n=1 Tax=Acetobacter sp. TaxID=440 RepID=UPI0039EA3B8F